MKQSDIRALEQIGIQYLRSNGGRHGNGHSFFCTETGRDLFLPYNTVTARDVVDGLIRQHEQEAFEKGGKAKIAEIKNALCIEESE